jgi:hypothetical protein
MVPSKRHPQYEESFFTKNIHNKVSYYLLPNEEYNYLHLQVKEKESLCKNKEISFGLITKLSKSFKILNHRVVLTCFNR